MAKKSKASDDEQPAQVDVAPESDEAGELEGEVLAHFVLQGPELRSMNARVLHAHKGELLDLEVDMPGGRKLTLERVARRPEAAVITYPSWEPAEAAASPSR